MYKPKPITMKPNFEDIRYERNTQTFRSVPQNYWLASIKNNKLVFDSWDAAIKDYRFKFRVIIFYILLRLDRLV